MLNDSLEENNQTLVFPVYIQVTATGFCIVILIVGCIGNILVPLVVCQTRELKNSTNLFLINLSFADLLVLVVCMPTVLIELHSRPEVWVLGEILCKLVPFLERSAAHASILTMLIISVERYYAICWPLRASSTCTRGRGVSLIAVLWCLALASTFPVLPATQYSDVSYFDGSTVKVCRTGLHESWQITYFIGSLIVLFWLPLVILVALYAVIAKNLVWGEKISTNARQERSRRRVVVMLAAVVILFFTCLMPYRIFLMWIILTPEGSVQDLGMETFYTILYFTRVMLYIDAAVNPILYAAVSSKFRNSCVRLLCCKEKPKGRLILFYSSIRSRSSGHNRNHQMALISRRPSLV